MLVPENWFFVDEKEPVAHALVEVVEASDVNPSDLNGLSDPYVKGQLGACRFKTKILKKTLSPKWQEEFKIPILTWDSPNILNFEVQDKDRFSDDSLDDCSVNIAGFKGGERNDMWLPLQNIKMGRLHLAITVTEDEAKAPRVRDNLEPINIEGQEETGIWVHQPGTEVSQIGEPRKGKSRCVDNNIRGVTLEASTGSNESSSPDENQEWEEGRVRERGGGWLLTGRSPRGESFGSEDAENKGHMKDVAKSILKQAEKSASHIKHVFSRKGSRKSRDDECSTVPENESVFGSEYPCEYSDDDDVQGIEIHTCL
uniref:C2 domain-containing protein n=1 Tax=Brassica oleracea var. oleracea TaxID=109376 RepID=A0A0D3ADM8_BRAOL